MYTHVVWNTLYTCDIYFSTNSGNKLEPVCLTLSAINRNWCAMYKMCFTKVRCIVSQITGNQPTVTTALVVGFLSLVSGRNESCNYTLFRKTLLTSSKAQPQLLLCSFSSQKYWYTLLYFGLSSIQWRGKRWSANWTFWQWSARLSTMNPKTPNKNVKSCQPAVGTGTFCRCCFSGGCNRRCCYSRGCFLLMWRHDCLQCIDSWSRVKSGPCIRKQNAWATFDWI